MDTPQLLEQLSLSIDMLQFIVVLSPLLFIGVVAHLVIGVPLRWCIRRMLLLKQRVPRQQPSDPHH